MEYRDYYAILGVSKDADEKTIKRAYRKLAREFHPDVNQDDKQAEQKFKEIGEAYAVLSDPDKRKKYDRFGAQWEQYERAGVNPDDFARYGPMGGGMGGMGGGGRTITPEELEAMFGGGLGGGHRSNGSGFSDFFESLFGGGMGGAGAASAGTRRPRTSRRGQDIEAEVAITLEEAFRGTQRTLESPDGKRIEVNIPAGVDTGSKVRASGQGGEGIGGGKAGDLYLRVVVMPHTRFRRDDADLYVPVEVDLYTAVLGGEVEVPTLERPVVLTIPAGSQNGRRFRLRGLGMSQLRDPDKRGDLFAELSVTIPSQLSEEERQLFERLRQLG